jgi:hypothetical protein
MSKLAPKAADEVVKKLEGSSEAPCSKEFSRWHWPCGDIHLRLGAGWRGSRLELGKGQKRKSEADIHRSLLVPGQQLFKVACRIVGWKIVGDHDQIRNKVSSPVDQDGRTHLFVKINLLGLDPNELCAGVLASERDERLVQSLAVGIAL